MLKFKYILISIILSGLFISSCDSVLDIEPDNQLLEDEAIQSKGDVQNLLNAAYSNMQSFVGGPWQRYSEMMADNFVPSSETNKRQQIFNRSTSAYFTADDAYREGYRIVWRVNKVMSLVNGFEMTDEERNRMTNEAKFLRAYAHFNLLRMFSQPYGYSSDNSHLGIVIKNDIEATIQMQRSTVDEVYKFIIEDLNDAVNLPNENGEYASSWAAKSLLAEVHFSMYNYGSAFDIANDVLTNGSAAFETTFEARDTMFEVGSANTETIFRLVGTDGVSNAGGGFDVFKSTGESVSIRVAKDFYRSAASNSSDLRASWYLAKNEGEPTEYYGLTRFNYDWMDVPLFYVTNLKFLRAESAILMNTPNLSIAIADVNDILVRAFGNDNNNLPADVNTDALLSEIRTQKRLELVGEGYRVYDLKRIGATENNNQLIRNAPWNCPGLSLQFPSSELAKGFVFNEEGGC